MCCGGLYLFNLLIKLRKLFLFGLLSGFLQIDGFCFFGKATLILGWIIRLKNRVVNTDFQSNPIAQLKPLKADVRSNIHFLSFFILLPFVFSFLLFSLRSSYSYSYFYFYFHFIYLFLSFLFCFSFIVFLITFFFIHYDTKNYLWKERTFPFFFFAIIFWNIIILRWDFLSSFHVFFHTRSIEANLITLRYLLPLNSFYRWPVSSSNKKKIN